MRMRRVVEVWSSSSCWRVSSRSSCYWNSKSNCSSSNKRAHNQTISTENSMDFSTSKRRSSGKSHLPVPESIFFHFLFVPKKKTVCLTLITKHFILVFHLGFESLFNWLLFTVRTIFFSLTLTKVCRLNLWPAWGPLFVDWSNKSTMKWELCVTRSFLDDALMNIWAFSLGPICNQ